MFFCGMIKITVGSHLHLYTFGDRVRHNFFESSKRWDNLQVHYMTNIVISKLCPQHCTTSAVTRIRYFKIELCGGTVNKTEMPIFMLFGTAYEIRTVASKHRYNISCQTLGYSSQVNKQSQAILSSPIKHLPRTKTLSERTTTANVQVL